MDLLHKTREVKQPMPLKPEYAENIIVGVVFHSDWMWYVSPPLLWVLDLDGYSGARYAQIGVKPDMTHIRSILIANKDTALSFLSDMSEYQVSTTYLRNIMKASVPPVQDFDNATKETLLWLLDEVLELYPSLYVNFDTQVLRTAYAEPMHISFEHYVPSGWEGYDAAVIPHVPQEHRYWIIDGIDYISRLSDAISKSDETGTNPEQPSKE
jgi:hypothetical protein